MDKNNQLDSSISLSVDIQKADDDIKQKPIPALTSCQIKTNTDNQKLSIYFTANKTYVDNLINKKQRPKIDRTFKYQTGSNCILHREFIIDQNQAKIFTGQYKQIKGAFFMQYSQSNAQFKLLFDENIVKKPDDYIWILFQYQLKSGTWKSKSYTPSQDKGIFTHKCYSDDLQQYLNPNLLVTISIKKKQTSNTDLLGIVNLGNTCFMNSVLQVLYYIKPLRKIILDTKTNNKLIKQLRQVFIMLMDLQEGKAIDAENLLQSYQKYNEHPRSQQDVQQFLLDFINQIEMQCPQVKSLWQGKCSQTTQSAQYGKAYKSVQQQQFAQLDVHMFDRKGNLYHTIEDAIKDVVKQQEVQELIDHDQHGKIKVAKFRTYISLPDVIFINLKRYQWNREKMRLSKIFNPIEYKENLNLGFIFGTPGNDQVNPECDYTLFSVIVHKGSSPHHGHYFAFVNTSESWNEPDWICFNDSCVNRSDPDEVLGFTGKKEKQISLDKKLGRFVDREIESDESSYLLVYIRTKVFNDYQGIKTNIPLDYFNEKKQKKTKKQKQSLQNVHIYVVQNYDILTDIFDSNLDVETVKLAKNDYIRDAINQLLKQVYRIQGKYMYRVYRHDRKLKRVQDYQIIEDLSKFRRGYQSPDFVLVFLDNLPRFYQMKKGQYKGILNVFKNELQNLTIPNLGLISVSALKKLQEQVEQNGGSLYFKNERKEFQYQWNRFIEVQIIKNMNQ